MSKEETRSGGLFSKVVRFVRNPTVNWTELDSVQDDRDSQYSKQALKEMIERKRRNDFVRRREFDQLRKLRQREAQEGRNAEDPAARPSFFQSSITSPDERAVTLKKIDEIEAQMSQQWWQGKQTSQVPLAPSTSQVPLEPTTQAALQLPDTQSGEDAEAVERAYAPTTPIHLQAGPQTKPSVAPLFLDDSINLVGPGSNHAGRQASAPEAPLFSAPAPRAEPEAPVEPEEFVHEPDLEEAAIRFASGDHAGAEAGLLDVIAQHQQDDPQHLMEIWMTLFDLYRATGQHDRFDTLGIDYAARFHRSAPVWFSLPEQLGLVSGGEAAEEPAVQRRDFNWSAPSTMTLSSVAALQAALGRAASPWTLGWGRVTAIDEAAVPLLANLFIQWADLNGQFVFSGVSTLNALLESKTQPGDASRSTEWWRLRMAVLRLMGLLDAFEAVALDYCITYEVSPPSWTAPRCGYSDSAVAAAPDAPANAGGLLSSAAAEAALPAAQDSARTPALIGHIDDDAVPVLESFLPLAQPGEPLVISCDRLIRVDFGAAGSVLNWAASQQARGLVVHFKNLHRLVAILFNVIGVNEHARIIPRNN